jgi:hypothetical protein
VPQSWPRERERKVKGCKLQRCALVCCLVQRGLTDTDTGCSIMLRQSTTAGQRLVSRSTRPKRISDGATLGLRRTRAGPKCAEKQAHGHRPHLGSIRLVCIGATKHSKLINIIGIGDKKNIIQIVNHSNCDMVSTRKSRRTPAFEHRCLMLISRTAASPPRALVRMPTPPLCLPFGRPQSLRFPHPC